MVIDVDGQRLLSRRVLNDETALLELMQDVLALDEDALWGGRPQPRRCRAADRPAGQPRPAADPPHRPDRAPRLRHLPRRGKTDAKDAFVIADRARQINRLRAQLLEIRQTLGHALELVSR
ncbi:transposase [Kitasatospora sp. NPDC051914]|uniref:IS110 family transposase n=1 Tax=Kitasatospora sp. NPDC051914 TaxID=3154945 RepID=UPI00343FF357